MICHHCNREIGIAAECPFCRTYLLKTPAPYHLPAGTVIGEKYRISGVLGEGGFGITYLGVHETLGLPLRMIRIKQWTPTSRSIACPGSQTRR